MFAHLVRRVYKASVSVYPTDGKCIEIIRGKWDYKAVWKLATGICVSAECRMWKEQNEQNVAFMQVQQ